MELTNAMTASVSGLKAQSVRLRTIAENLAHAESISTQAGGDPYRRKLVDFQSVVDRATGSDVVRIKKIHADNSDFKMTYNPTHPAADASGYVKMPNVNSFIEMMDMKEAQRSYQANLEAITTSRSMLRETIGLLGK